MIVVRPIEPSEVEDARAILNEIIDIGGTTAHQAQFSRAKFEIYYINGPGHIACHVALDAQSRVAGFQAIDRNPDLPDNCADVATFARQTNKLRGVGQALFPYTCAAARRAGCIEINATIRADNVPGLAYYSSLGFVDHSTIRALPLADGTPVDRIRKRFDLTRNSHIEEGAA